MNDCSGDRNVLTGSSSCEDVTNYHAVTSEVGPHDPDTWNNEGISLHNLKRHDEAVRCYDKALELDPHYVHAWNNKGNSLGSLGPYDEAVRCYDKALELDPRYVLRGTTRASSCTVSTNGVRPSGASTGPWSLTRVT